MNDPAGADRLARQLEFLLAVDALKRVARASRVTGGARRENSAEHSWHVAHGSGTPWAHCERVIDEAVGRGRVRDGPDGA